jgi:hypothetical protein
MVERDRHVAVEDLGTGLQVEVDDVGDLRDLLGPATGLLERETVAGGDGGLHAGSF